MLYPNATQIVTHLVNGFADEDEFVEIDGEKYVPDSDDPTKAKVDDAGNKVPYKAKSDDGDGKDKGDKKDGDGNSDGDGESQKSLEELAKTNPEVAKMLEDKKKLEDDAKKAAEDKKKADEEEAKKKGEWQKLAEDKDKELEEAKKELEKKDTILGKYVNSVKETLKEVMATIPKENVGLIPEGFSPREKLEYISRNAKLLGAKMTGNSGGGVSPNDVDPNATDDEKIQNEIDELRKKENKTQADHRKIWELSKKLKEVRASKKD